MPITKEAAAKFTKHEVSFDPAIGWPNAEDLYYECLICGEFVHSSENDECKCRNIYVDAAAGRAGARDEHKVRLVKITKVEDV